MTVGRKEYTDAELMRMQRDAEDRVREMHSRARQVVEQEPASPSPRNRNWNSNPNMRRPNNRRPQPERTQAERPRDEPQPEAKSEPEEQRQGEATSDSAASENTQGKTTVVEDVMRALNLDEDYLLIIGLLLILINQRADTTLILALAYLLI